MGNESSAARIYKAVYLLNPEKTHYLMICRVTEEGEIWIRNAKSTHPFSTTLYLPHPLSHFSVYMSQNVQWQMLCPSVRVPRRGSEPLYS